MSECICIYIYLYISSEAALADVTGDMGVAEEGMSEERATQDAVGEDAVAGEGVAQHDEVHGEAHDGAAGVMEVEVEGVGQVVEASDAMDEEATRATHVSSSSCAHTYPPPHMASEEMNEEVPEASHEPVATHVSSSSYAHTGAAHVSSSSYAHTGATHESVVLGALPAGWQACTDAETGRTFYQNTVTQATQWEYPSDAADVGLGGVGEEGEGVVVEGTDEGESVLVGTTCNAALGQACNTMQAIMAQDNAIEGVQDNAMQGIMAQEASEGGMCEASGMLVQHFAGADQGGG